MSTQDDHDRSLSGALADLAATMPDDPNRVEGIYARARRLRNRRRAGRAAAGAIVAAGTIAGIIAVRPGPSAVSTVPASAPTTDQASPLPACSTLTLPPLPSTNPVSADRAKAAAAGGDSSGATTTDHAVNGRAGFKGLGTVAAVTDTSISITATDLPPGGPSELTAAFTAQTSFRDGDTELTARPAVNTGDHVAFAAIVNDAGGYDLLLLELHPDSNVSDAKKAAGTQTAPDSTPPDTSIAKGIATITAVQPGSLTLNFVERPLAGQNVTAALAPDVVYMAGDQKCVDPALAAGQQIGVVLHRGDGDTYTVQQVVLFQSS